MEENFGAQVPHSYPTFTRETQAPPEPRKTRVVSIVNHKGGVGKTTSAVNIAASLCAEGYKTLVVDLDPQGSATLHLGLTDNGYLLYDALQNATALPVKPSGVPYLDIVPSGPRLTEIGFLYPPGDGAELLERCFEKTAGDWDWILLDCPPNMGVLTLGALKVCNHIVVPTEATPLAFNGLKQLIDILGSLRRIVTEKEIAAVIPCRCHIRRRIHWETIQKIEELLPGKVSSFIRENVAVAAAAGHGRPVHQHAPRSNGTEDYREATQWLIAQVKKAEAISTATLPAEQFAIG